MTAYTPMTATGSEREWRLDEAREEFAEHVASGAHGLSAEHAQLFVMLIDHRKVLLAACESALPALEILAADAKAVARRTGGTRSFGERDRADRMRAAIAKAGGK